MRQEQKGKPTLRVIRMFEPDRMASVNLLVAYEQLVPTEKYRLCASKQETEKLEILPIVEEVTK